MAKINQNYSKLPGSYLFAEIGRKVVQYKAEHPNSGVISLGIGDVTRPLAPSVIAALHKATDEMADSATFRGYAPYEGYEFLRTAIAEGDYKSRGTDISPDEIFVSDGAKSDTGNIGDIFDLSCVVAVCDPVYPVYIDSNAMSGRAGDFRDVWDRIVYMPSVSENGFSPSLPDGHVDLIYLCLPNNPTGTTLNRRELKVWVDYACEHGAVILFDAAYEAFITEEDVPHSVFEIDGAKRCAIEFRSFSKTAGFTGLRCGYTVIPRELEIDGVSIHSLWMRRQSTKFNGTAYIVQRAAEAVFSESGRREIGESIAYYLENAGIIRRGLADCGFEVFGGINAPYIWLKTPGGVSSWEFFDRLLSSAEIVGTPGSGFGPSGEGYFRLTAFGSRENTIEALNRIKTRLSF